ncbi:metal ABC transporter ATP-binding protein [Variovorax paradoxus]|uniref:Iron(3+)-hydroxamate import ATP-binding protein FhuC n=1 Tax=Variovorax paradoxus TaxID=34073 RepID=A0A0H2LYJ9_VARPD|nr:metal ABC transporter ATP-binding protein [Variovorax paradoxus]KLN55268.1 iron(3+)-hydroxamate import ATP-binding protein FhuC [Variovorax paradoxus]
MSGAPLPPAILLNNLTVAYRGHPAVHHLSGEFAPGSLTAIVGPNGAGKTSLLAAIMGRIRPAEGKVSFDGASRDHVAWLPQQAEIDRSFPIRVFDLVALGHWERLGCFRGIAARQRDAVGDALEAVGLGGFQRRSIAELSAGQFQRVLFARVLLQDAPVILLDEPFNAIDARTTADLLAVVARWHAEARTVIAVLHDLEQVRLNFDRTLLMARRCVAWGPTAEVLHAENLFRARQMAEAWDEDATACREAA